MPAILLTILARLGGAGRWLAADLTRTAFLALLTVCAFLCWRLASIDGDRDDWRDKAKAYELASQILEDADAAADAEGLDAAHDMKGTIDAGNDRARDAAADSDDPLAAGIGELRRQGGGEGN